MPSLFSDPPPCLLPSSSIMPFGVRRSRQQELRELGQEKNPPISGISSYRGSPRLAWGVAFRAGTGLNLSCCGQRASGLAERGGRGLGQSYRGPRDVDPCRYLCSYARQVVCARVGGDEKSDSSLGLGALERVPSGCFACGPGRRLRCGLVPFVGSHESITRWEMRLVLGV